MSTPRKSRRERKASAARIARFHTAREQAIRGAAGHGTTAPVSASEPAPDLGTPTSQAVGGLSGRMASGGPEPDRQGGSPRRRGRRTPRRKLTGEARRTEGLRTWSGRDSWILTGAAVALVVAVCVAIGRGAPVLGHGADPWALASGASVAAVVGAGMWALLRARTRPPTRLLAALVACAALVVVAFSVGAATSRTLNGRILPMYSTEAQVMAQSESLASDISRISELDGLLGLDTPAARARFGDFEPAAKELEAISVRWAESVPEDFADASLAPVAAAVSSAANFEAVAMQKKRDLLTTDDSRLAEEVSLYRQSARQSLVSAGPKLQQVAKSYGFTVTLDTNGPTE